MELFADAARAGFSAQACDRLGLDVRAVRAVEHTRRWDPFFHRAKELIDAGAIGEVRTVTGTLHGERAMIFRNGTHIVDLMNYYAGSAPTAVFAKLEEGFEDFTEYRGDGGHAPESEPGASAFITYANGVRGFYNGTKGTFGNAEWDVVGPTGRIRISGNVAELWRTCVKGGWLVVANLGGVRDVCSWQR